MVVLNGPLVFIQRSVGITTVVVGEGKLGVNVEAFIEVLDGPLVFTKRSEGIGTVDIGLCRLWAEADGSGEVLDGPLVLTGVGVGKTTVVIGLGILRVEANCLIEFSYDLYLTRFLSCLYTNIVKVSCCTTTS